jgi:hypothetical protein
MNMQINSEIGRTLQNARIRKQKTCPICKKIFIGITISKTCSNACKCKLYRFNKIKTKKEKMKA